MMLDNRENEHDFVMDHPEHVAKFSAFSKTFLASLG